MTWRHHPTDPVAEAQRLDAHEYVRRLGWDDERLERELARATSAKGFKHRVRQALLRKLEADDPPRLMFRTRKGNLSQEPEQVRADCGRRRSGGGQCCEKHITEEARQVEKDRVREGLDAARSALKMIAAAQAGESCRYDLRSLEKKLDALERKLAA